MMSLFNYTNVTIKNPINYDCRTCKSLSKRIVIWDEVLLFSFPFCVAVQWNHVVLIIVDKEEGLKLIMELGREGESGWRAAGRLLSCWEIVELLGD
jgi:hypothetical protein